MKPALFPRIDRIGTCMECRRIQCPLYRSKVVAKLICRICLVRTGEVIP